MCAPGTGFLFFLNGGAETLNNNMRVSGNVILFFQLRSKATLNNFIFVWPCHKDSTIVDSNVQYKVLKVSLHL